MSCSLFVDPEPGSPMRLLIGVVHFYRSGDGRHGSLAADPAPRIRALSQLILNLHRLFGASAATLNHCQRRVDAVVDGGGEVDLRICVIGVDHVLDQLPELSTLYRQTCCDVEDPRLLGFACQQMLAMVSRKAEEDGNPYDYIAYLEDDIVINDIDFFLKLRNFNYAFGDNYLLMPNRLETMENSRHVSRFYIDGDYNPLASEAYRRSGSHQLCLEHLGEMIRFDQPSNLHSGCFFLNRTQAEIYRSSGHAGEVDITFHGPLESAATLGMLKTFQVMKPALENGRFLTVEHAGRNFMNLVNSLSR